MKRLIGFILLSLLIGCTNNPITTGTVYVVDTLYTTIPTSLNVIIDTKGSVAGYQLDSVNWDPIGHIWSPGWYIDTIYKYIIYEWPDYVDTINWYGTINGLLFGPGDSISSYRYLSSDENYLYYWDWDSMPFKYYISLNKFTY
jgi:hypothetical protein